MKQEIEIEFKNLLTKNEYDHMLYTYPFPKQAKEQINYYFETAEFAFKQYHSALRIRKKDEDFTLTLKEPHPNGLLETHVPLAKSEAHSWIDGNFIEKQPIKERLLKLDISLDELRCYGSLTTKRRECYLNNTLFVLDYSEYNGKADYEFELEADDYDIGKKMFLETLDKSGIRIKETPNKIERFFASLQ